jgi:hypothetical protein
MPTQPSHITTLVGQELKLSNPEVVAFDSHDNLYIADRDNNRIVKISSIGEISVVAGTGTKGFSGDGGPATAAQLNLPCGLAIDSKDNLYIADSDNHRIRRVGSDGNIVTIAGTGESGFSGDNGLTFSAKLNFPRDIVIDKWDYLYIVDTHNCRIRMVDVQDSCIIRTVAGNGKGDSSQGDDGPATAASLLFNFAIGFDGVSIAVDNNANLYISQIGDHRIRKVDNSGKISTIAGGNGQGSSGDGGLATQAKLSYPYGLATDSNGNLYIADADNHRIRKVDSGGTINSIAGKGVSEAGDPALAPPLYGVQTMAFDRHGNLYIVEADNHLIQKINLERPAFEIDFDNPFSVIAVVSPETIAKKASEVETLIGSTPITTTESMIATGNIISQYAPYQNKAGGWQLSILTDPPGQEKGTYLSFSVHSKAGEDGKVNTCAVLGSLMNKYSVNQKSKENDEQERQDSDAVFKKYIHSITAVKDKGVIQLYLDGTLLASNTYTGNIDVDNAEPLKIGKLLPEPTDTDQQGGIVRKVSLWNKALSQTELINYSNCMMNPMINFPLAIDYQVLYNTPKQPKEDFTMQVKGILSLSPKTGKTHSESFDQSKSFVPKIQGLDNLKLQVAQQIDPSAKMEDLKNFTFEEPKLDDQVFKVTITATRLSDQADSPPQTATITLDYTPDTNDEVHYPLFQAAVNDAASKLIEQINKEQNEVSYQYNAENQQVYSEIKIEQCSDCAGFWTFYGPKENNGLDLSTNKNNVPLDQRIPSKALKTVLPFYLEEQEMSNWCWAATSLSVAKYYNASYQDTQCQLVTKAFQDPLASRFYPGDGPKKPLTQDQSCCKDSSLGNYTYYITAVSEKLNLLESWSKSVITLAQILEKLMGGQPIIVRIGWDGGGGHFVVLSGQYSDKSAEGVTQDWVVINDPWSGMSFMRMVGDSFSTKYQGSGTWTHTCCLRAVWTNLAGSSNQSPSVASAS